MGKKGNERKKEIENKVKSFFCIVSGLLFQMYDLRANNEYINPSLERQLYLTWKVLKDRFGAD